MVVNIMGGIEFERKRFNSAKQLLNYLRLSNGHWTGNELDSETSRNWIFRGHADSNWKLTPSAWRKDYVTKYIKPRENDRHFMNRKISPSEINSDPLSRLVFNAMVEFSLIYDFISLSDQLGQNAPEFLNFQNFWVNFEQHYITNFFAGEGNVEIWCNSAVALAQHHGIPTRLIDWTYNSLAAAYFAASDQHLGNNIAIYAVNLGTLDSVAFDAPGIDFIKTIHVPRSENSYLHAQQGLFTYDGSGDRIFQERGAYPTLDQSILRILNNRDTTLSGNLRPKILTLKASESFELLKLLRLEGISKPSLMPSYDNIADEVKGNHI